MDSVRENNKRVLECLLPGDVVEFDRGLYNHWAVYIGTYEKIPAMEKTVNLLKNIYKYVKYSCTNTASLKEVQTAFKEAPLVIKQAKHHRLLSHEAAVTSIVKPFQLIVVDLEKKSITDDPVCNGILKVLKKTQTLRCLLFLADTLKAVAKDFMGANKDGLELLIH